MIKQKNSKREEDQNDDNIFIVTNYNQVSESEQASILPATQAIQSKIFDEANNATAPIFIEDRDKQENNYLEYLQGDEIQINEKMIKKEIQSNLKSNCDTTINSITSAQCNSNHNQKKFKFFIPFSNKSSIKQLHGIGNFQKNFQICMSMREQRVQQQRVQQQMKSPAMQGDQILRGESFTRLSFSKGQSVSDNLQLHQKYPRQLKIVKNFTQASENQPNTNEDQIKTSENQKKRTSESQTKTTQDQNTSEIDSSRLTLNNKRGQLQQIFNQLNDKYSPIQTNSITKQKKITHNSACFTVQPFFYTRNQQNLEISKIMTDSSQIREKNNSLQLSKSRSKQNLQVAKQDKDSLKRFLSQNKSEYLFKYHEELESIYKQGCTDIIVNQFQTTENESSQEPLLEQSSQIFYKCDTKEKELQMPPCKQTQNNHSPSSNLDKFENNAELKKQSNYYISNKQQYAISPQKRKVEAQFGQYQAQWEQNQCQTIDSSHKNSLQASLQKINSSKINSAKYNLLQEDQNQFFQSEPSSPQFDKMRVFNQSQSKNKNEIEQRGQQAILKSQSFCQGGQRKYQNDTIRLGTNRQLISEQTDKNSSSEDQIYFQHSLIQHKHDENEDITSPSPKLFQSNSQNMYSPILLESDLSNEKHFFGKNNYKTEYAFNQNEDQVCEFTINSSEDNNADLHQNKIQSKSIYKTLSFKVMREENQKQFLKQSSLSPNPRQLNFVQLNRNSFNTPKNINSKPKKQAIISSIPLQPNIEKQFQNYDAVNQQSIMKQIAMQREMGNTRILKPKKIDSKEDKLLIIKKQLFDTSHLKTNRDNKNNPTHQKSVNLQTEVDRNNQSQTITQDGRIESERIKRNSFYPSFDEVGTKSISSQQQKSIFNKITIQRLNSEKQQLMFNQKSFQQTKHNLFRQKPDKLYLLHNSENYHTQLKIEQLLKYPKDLTQK